MRGSLGQRPSLRFDGSDHGQELLRQMAVRVVQHRAVDEGAAVQPFLCVRLESHMNPGARQVGENGAHAREQFAVDHHIKADAAHRQDRAQGVCHETAQRFIPDGNDIFRRHHAQQIEHFAILGEHQDMQRGIGIASAQIGEHGLRQYQAAHFRQQYDQDAPGLGDSRLAEDHAPNSFKQRNCPADRHSGPMVDCTLESNIQ